MKSFIENNWFKLAVIILLIASAGKLPYGYYQLLRWVTTAAGAYAAFQSHQSNKKVWTWIFGIIAVLFNPIVPFYFSKSTWQPIDQITAVIFFVSLFSKNSESHKNID
jgi:hypothetical protein